MQFLHLLYLTLCGMLTLIGPFCSSWKAADPNSTRAEQTAKLFLNRLFRAEERALNFFKREAVVINMDALIGTRIAEGRLTVLLNNIANGTHPNATSDLIESIRKVRDLTTNVSDLALPYIAERTPEYNEMGAWIQKGYWTLNYQNRETVPTLRKQPVFGGKTVYAFTDSCFTELMEDKDCYMSEFCKEKMTEDGYRDYSLTHEVLYLEVAEIEGCLNATDLIETDKLLNKFCAQILQAAEMYAKKGFGESGFGRDLFLEQHSLCGMVGFQDFYRQEWLEEILQWQWPEGCFGDVTYPVLKWRERRDDKVLRHGCSSHLTAVAIEAMAAYIRYIMDYLYKVKA